VNDAATVSEDSGATAIPVLSNDTDPEGDARTISSASDPAKGTVVLTGGTAGARTGLTYQPDANYCNNPPGSSPDAFTYTINGGDSATVSVAVNCVDDAPVAVDNSASVTEDAAATAINVLSNDTDIDGGPKTINSVTQPANGDVVITGGGTGLTYKPNANYCNDGSPTETFTYTLNGGDSATVSVTVNCVDDPPVAVSDPSGGDPPITVSVDDGPTAIDVLANDDPNGDGGPVAINSVTHGAHGSVAITGGGDGLTYDLTDSYCITQPTSPSDSFTYALNGGSSTTVSLTIDCTDPPIATNDSATVAQDDPPTAISVLGNDLNSDGGPMLIVDNTLPPNGILAITGGGSGLTYQPKPSYCNTPSGPADSFTYTLNGGSIATVFMTVTCPPMGTPGAPQGQTLPAPVVKKCGKGFKKVKGKCRKKKRRRK
jgi:hypothetical protein